MPKKNKTPAKAGSKPSSVVNTKPKGFDPAFAKTPSFLHGAKLTIKKNLRPGKSGQR